MSWNLFMVRTKTNAEEHALIEDEERSALMKHLP